MDRINLIPASRQRARHKRIRRRAWLIICLGYSGLLLIACLSHRSMGYMNVHEHEDEITQLQGELAELQASHGALSPKLVERRLVLSASRSIADQPDWSILLAFLANELLDEQVVLSSCALGPERGASGVGDLQDRSLALALSGYAKTTPAVSRFILRLEQAGLFDSVSLTRTNREPYLDGQAIAFDILCLIDGGGEADIE